MDILQEIKQRNESFVENENFSGVKSIIVDNYNDQAHFIYELLQNADDAGATNIKFELFDDRLIVIHNGKVFSEKDLKAICSISKGTKSDDYTKIGKFGIGFKSVFVYTDSPQIYSGEYQFEIKELVLPEKRVCDLVVNPEDTVFVLPFNNKKTKNSAFSQIAGKLKELRDEALLFLSHLELIDIHVCGEVRTIKKTQTRQDKYEENMECEIIEIEIADSEEQENESVKYLRLKKEKIQLTDYDDEQNPVKIENQVVMIAFILDDEENVISLSEADIKNTCYYVFFPTMIPSGREFLIHAPFVTKSSRDTIAKNNESNNILMQNIGVLAANSFLILAELNKLNRDNVEEIFFSCREEDLIYKTYEKELYRLLGKNEKIIPCDDGECRGIDNIIFTKESEGRYKKIINLFGKEKVAGYFDADKDADAGVFTIVKRYRYYEKKYEFYNFIEEQYEINLLSVENLLEKLTAVDYESLDSKTFASFTELLVNKNNSGIYSLFNSNVDIRKYPLLRLHDHSHIIPNTCDNIYMDNGTIDEVVVQNKAAEYIYREIFKIKNYSVELKEARKALKTIQNDSLESFDLHIEKIRKILSAVAEQKMSVEEIQNTPMIFVENQATKETKQCRPADVILGRWDKIDRYVLFEGVKIDLLYKKYIEYLKLEDLKKIGCREELKTIKYYNLSLKAGYEDHVHAWPRHAQNRNFDCRFQLEHFSEIMQQNIDFERSIEIMKIANKYRNQIKDWIEWSSKQDYSNKGKSYGTEEAFSNFGIDLVSYRWIVGKDGGLYCPSEITIEEIREEYKEFINVDLAKKLGFKEIFSEKMAEQNKKLEKEDMFAIPLSEKEEYEAYKKEKEEKKRRELLREQNRHSFPEAMSELEYSSADSSMEEFEDEMNYNSIPNQERRKEKILEQFERLTVEQALSGKSGYGLSKKSKVNPQEKAFLQKEYDGKCQICGKIIKGRDNKNIFWAVNLVDTDRLRREYKEADSLAWNSLCLCPNCATEYRYGNTLMKGFVEQVRAVEIIDKSQEPFEFDIRIQGEKTNISYSPKHVHNLQIALAFYDKQEMNLEKYQGEQE